MAITRAQISIDPYDYTVPKQVSLSPDDAEEMIYHDAIAIASAFAVAPIVDSPWAIESDNDSHAEWIEEQLFPHRSKFVRTAMYAEIMYGWSAFELSYTLDAGLDRIQFLQPRNVWVRRHPTTNDFLGLMVIDVNNGEKFWLPPEYCLFISQDPLGGYAKPRLLNAKAAYDGYIEMDTAAVRYAKKMAGGLWKLDYRPGTTLVDGEETDNYEIAETVAKAIRSGGVMITPNQPEMIGEKAVKTFEVERHDSQAAQADMTIGLKYYDERMTRAVLVPSRTIMEGSYGTKAESDAQAAVALQCMELYSKELVEVVNKYIIPRLLMAKFGVEDTVKLISTPLDDKTQARYMALFTQLLADPSVGPDIAAALDVAEIGDTLGLPMTQDQIDLTPEPQPTALVDPNQDPNQQPPNA